MKTKGFTLIEILIVIVLLGMVISAIVSIYTIGLKDYQINFTKSGFQKDLNFSLDDLNKNVKLSAGVLQTYSTYTLSGTTLIISMPAIDSTGSFLYTNGGQTLTTDTFVYYLSGTSLHRKIFADPTSFRYKQNNQDIIIAANVTGLTFTYLPSQGAAEEVQTAITMSKTVEKTTVKAAGTMTAFMRNK